MKKLAILALILAVPFGAFAKTAKKSKKENKNAEPQITLATKADSASYALGVAIGSQMLTNLEQGNYDKGIYAKAFCDVIFGNPTTMTASEADAFMRKYVKELQEQAIEASKAEEQAFLDSNKKREGVITTESGLQYQVVRMGDGPKPTANNTVKVHYEGFLTNGTKFDSSIDRGEPTQFRLSGVIKGWTEGLQLMPVGSKFTFYIPSDLGYGAYGAGNTVPPYSTLIFEVELLDIVD